MVPGKYKHGKYLKGPAKEYPWITRLGVWLMTPSIMFEPLAAETPSVILTSGTLFPMSPWELGKTFVQRLSSNVGRFNHVVNQSQVGDLNCCSATKGWKIMAL